MTTSIRLPEDLLNDAKRFATLEHRSVPKQVEHWARIGKVVESNPDLPYAFIADVIMAMSEESVPFDLESLKGDE